MRYNANHVTVPLSTIPCAEYAPRDDPREVFQAMVEQAIPSKLIEGKETVQFLH
jgi:hypothetical protein